MARYIDAEQIVPKLFSVTITTDLYGQGISAGIDQALRIIKEHPTADVEEVKHGAWLDDIEEIMPLNGSISRKALVGYRCSVCNRPEFRKEHYCNCGAKMDGGNIE